MNFYSSLKISGTYLFNSKDNVITVTELNAIANALYSGLKKIPHGIKIPAAIGIRMTLYAKAQNKFNFTRDIVFLLI